MLSGASAGISSLPSSFSSSEHKSDSSSVNSRTLLPQPSSAEPPATADQVIELSVSSDELASWRRRHQHPQTGPMPWPGRTRNVLRRYSPLVPPTALLIALVVLLVQDLAKAHSSADSLDLPVESNETVLQWSTCELDNVVANLYNLSAQCVTVTLPLCYDGICDAEDDNATIAVSFKRIPALGKNDTNVSAQTVWYLPDRPDVQTREDAEMQMALLYEEMRGEVDIYTLDLRGSGNSTPLACNASDGLPLQTAIFARNDGVLNFSDVQNCANRLQELGYTNLKAFSLTSAARDIEQIITEFQTDSQVTVYALGYSTVVAQQLLQRNILQIVGYVFDGALGGPESAISLSYGAETLAYDATRSDGDFGDVSDDFLSWCQTDADCSKMFSNVSTTTTLNTTLVEVYTRLDADTTSMCAMILLDVDTSGKYNSATTTATPPSYVLRQLLGLMLKSTTLWPFIPVVVYRFHRCGSEDLTVLTQLVNSTFATELDESTSDLLFAIQTFSELWEVPSPDHTELTKRFTDATISSGRVYTQLQACCLFTGATSDACMNSSASASSSSSVGSLLSYEGTTMNASAAVVPSGSSVLFLSGGLDALSPPKYTTALFNALQTDSKTLLVVPNNTHGVVQTALLSNGTACARQVLRSYVLSSGNLSAYDGSCMAALPTPNLAISNTSSLLVLGVADAYDGVLVVSTSNSSSDSNSGSVDVISNSGSSESSASSGSSLDDVNKRISALESSRHRYEVALIVVASVLAAIVIAAIAVVIYRHRRTHQLAGEEAMLRRMRGDEENELEIMRSIYLLSSISPSSGEAGRPR